MAPGVVVPVLDAAEVSGGGRVEERLLLPIGRHRPKRRRYIRPDGHSLLLDRVEHPKLLIQSILFSSDPKPVHFMSWSHDRFGPSVKLSLVLRLDGLFLNQFFIGVASGVLERVLNSDVLASSALSMVDETCL